MYGSFIGLLFLSRVQSWGASVCFEVEPWALLVEFRVIRVNYMGSGV